MENIVSLPFKYPVTGKNFTVTTRNGRRTAIGTPFVFQGDTQPVLSREALALTEGRLSSGVIVVLSEEVLKISTEGESDSSKGTYVLFEGKWYEVVSEASANSPISEIKSINHYEYIAEYREKEVA